MKSLIRFALILGGTLAASPCLRAQAPPAAAAATNNSGPRIQFNTEDYDFGKILSGDPIKYTFVATNRGDETLEISNARGSCSCTVVGEGSARNAWTLQKVAPGETCRIPVEIATASFGAQTIAKSVTVTSNDKARPTVNLQIHGKIWVPIEVSPATVFFNLVPGTASNDTQVLKIFNRMETPLTLSDPQCTTNAFSVVLKTNVAGRGFELAVTAALLSNLPPSFGATLIQGGISLKTSVPTMNPLKIGVFETIYPEITVYPASIQLPAGPLAQASTNHVTIRGASRDLILSDPGANVPGVEMTVNVIRTNRQYYLSVLFPRGFEARTNQSAVLTVKTDNPDYPVLSIPVRPMSGVIINRPPAVPPPGRTSVLPASNLAGAPTNSSGAPVPSPNPALRANPPHP
ncbi:MAG: DUF1573 domain-containing protein [Verrucomicrobiota bacterium]